MENLTLQQLINQTKEALIEAGASNYYQNVFKTLSKQLLLYAKEHDAESFSMDFGLQFLEDHYSMSSKIEQKRWCATYSRCINALAEYQHSGNVTLYLVMGIKEYTLFLTVSKTVLKPTSRIERKQELPKNQIKFSVCI